MSEVGDLNWEAGCDISEPEDEVIDGLDLKILADAWLTTEGIADIHGVGIVNSIDFAIQADNWLEGLD